MVFQRRQLLPSPSFPFGSSFILGRNQLGIGADRRTANDFLPPLLGPLFAMLQERNTGGVSLKPPSYEDSVWQQEAGPTVFDLQPEKSDFFQGTQKAWMLNFRIRDLGKMAVQLPAAGIAVGIDPQSHPQPVRP
jgi:hypothetical protein